MTTAEGEEHIYITHTVRGIGARADRIEGSIRVHFSTSSLVFPFVVRDSVKSSNPPLCKDVRDRLRLFDRLTIDLPCDFGGSGSAPASQEASSSVGSSGLSSRNLVDANTMKTYGRKRKCVEEARRPISVPKRQRCICHPSIAYSYFPRPIFDPTCNAHPRLPFLFFGPEILGYNLERW